MHFPTHTHMKRRRSNVKKSSLTAVQATEYTCTLCREKFESQREGANHAKIGLVLPYYHIGDRVKFKVNTSHNQFVTYANHEGTILNLMLDERWLQPKTEERLLNSEHETRYLYGYQIRADNGHIYEECVGVELITAAPTQETYEGGKKVYSPSEFQEEMQRDPRWKQFITPRFG